MIYKHERSQRIKGEDLPNEILLQIYPYMPLQGLIAARGVDRRWRSLVSQAYIYPIRQRLLELYLYCLEKPAFLDSRPDVIPHIIPYDRDDYLKFLPDVIPEEFELWIREWPAYGVIGWIWPGLKERLGVCKDWSFTCRCNCIGHCPPFVKTITFHQRVANGASGGLDLSSSSDGILFHAAAYLPVGTDITLAGDISWLDEGENEMVSIELTVMCVCTCTSDGRRYWLVLDGKRGGEKMKGVVYLGNGGVDLKSEDIVSQSWPDFLQLELDCAKPCTHPGGPCSAVDELLHSPKLGL
ncbi:hypothetical protein EIP91_007593 [Steccherinum ochraceum]|uniref:F-box domain-containing protein n=1 Tax=Steccherinum ochraceum TaxID=92696 RepID=A0A4V2MXA7_9APHY|nr:hypothetical protein EIP91_007593 [Steccherinum ochraceum]